MVGVSPTLVETMLPHLPRVSYIFYSILLLGGGAFVGLFRNPVVQEIMIKLMSKLTV